MQPKPIDYSLLDAVELPAFRRRLPWLLLLAAALPFPLIAALQDGLILIPYLLFVGIGMFVWWHMLKSKDEELFKAFLIVNGFEYLPKVHDFGSGTLFRVGHTKRGRLGAKGNLNGWPINFFQYVYSVGSGKNQRTYDSTVMRITLPRLLPHMVIDSVVEASNDGYSTLPIKFDKSQKIELEGDFAKFFDTYAPDSYGVSLLTVLAPDAMEIVMRHAALCDIEIVDNNLYFYWPDTDNTRSGIERKFQTVYEVLLAVGEKLQRADIYAHQKQAALHAEASQGIRLEERDAWYWRFVALFVFVMIAGIFIFPDGVGLVLTLIQVVLPVGFVILTIIRSVRRARLRRELSRQYHRH